MSLLKHLLISIAITIFIAWRFPETNLQIAIQNGSIALIFGLIVSTPSYYRHICFASFKNWYENYPRKQAQPYGFLSNQFISHLFLFCTTGISWLRT